MNRVKIYRIVEFIKSWTNFSYDSDDVIEGLCDILTYYEFYSILTNDEYYLLMDELLEMAEQSELAEAEFWASKQIVCGQDLQWGSDFRIPSDI